MDFLRILFGLFLLFLPVRPCSAQSELQRSADDPRRSPTILDIPDVTSIAGQHIFSISHWPTNTSGRWFTSLCP
ncbi:hypothetical protein B0H13DRAFT_2024903 [Mycena leptocephala]|nr:hypothetical protein B0H13DRAFT_2024903 [Mycena leptocephala]